MKNTIILLLTVIMVTCAPSIIASQMDYKQLASDEFEKGDYRKAIDYLKEAERKFPDDPEVYYHLGYYTHYLCYDSVPLSGFDLDKSTEVLRYLERAVELSPGYGDAYYFIGAECGARARIRLMNGDIEGAREEFRRGGDMGGYPDWLIEFGRNVLRSCDKGAILILGGDADTNPVQYLQIVEGYRNDVTSIPRALMSRPWFLKLISEGVRGVLPSAPISWSEYQIMNMHPYKWKTKRVQAPIEDGARAEYGIEEEFFSWELKSDIGDQRISAGSAAIADLIITNGFKRPLYFSLACGGFYGLNSNLQLSGLALKLLPLETAGTDFEIDTESAGAVLLESSNYGCLSSAATNDMPRVSGILVNYPAALLRLCEYHLERGRKEKAADIFELIDETGMEEYIKMGHLNPYLERYRSRIEE